MMNAILARIRAKIVVAKKRLKATARLTTEAN
jgi:hypothetical protein